VRLSKHEKHLYIPIELKNRELDSQVILAAEACLRGFRVYLGSHAAIYTALRTKKFRAGIFLDKGTQVESLTKWIKTKCERVFILDQELSPSLQVSNYLPDKNLVEKRFYPGTKNLIDGLFCVGPVILDSAQEYFKGSKNIYATGWPRMDLQKRYASVIYSKQIKELKEKHGDFLLFVSDFGLLVPISEIENPSKLKIYLDDLPLEFWNRTHHDFEQAIRVLREWDDNPSVPKIIVRPHIMDDIRIWRQKLQNLVKTQVIHSGDITPWVSASLGVVHRGSTVSIQAALMKKKVYYLAEAATSHNRMLVQDISDFAVGTKEPPTHEFLFRETSKNTRETLSKVMYTYEESAAVKIVKVLINHEIRHESAITRFKVICNYASPRAIRRFLGLLRDEIMYFIKPHSNPPQSKSIPKGIRRKDVEVGLLAEEHFSKVKIRKIGINLWELYIAS
jgi:surface carbohydrate biosynthesis protein